MATIAVISQKGGAGKTTIAVHLAAAAELEGYPTLLIDTDPQATASQWGSWRNGAPPDVIDSAPPRLANKIEAARAGGAKFIVIDTPPHADSAASAACVAADLILIPCRPTAFDLAAAQTTARLVQMFRKPAFVVFSAGPPKAPKLFEDATAAAEGWGLKVCPYRVADRAAFRHATAEGKTVMELDRYSRASEEIRALYNWACDIVNYSNSVEEGK
ncbi:MAG TPA: ParA family partition ATPase [Pseudolabrys sp.]|nr:ParA family partition ATPase [Pseudolabrys sp.]